MQHSPNNKHTSPPLQEANSLLLQYRTTQAIRKYQQLIENDSPKEQHQLLGLGSLAETKGKTEETLEWFKITKEQKEQQITAYDGLSVAYSLTQQFEQGEQYYSQMIQRYPNNLCFVLGIGTLYFNWGQHEKAQRQYTKIQPNSLNYRQAVKQLALLSFYNNELKQLKNYVNLLQDYIQKDSLLKLLSILTLSQTAHQMSALSQLCKQCQNYARPHFFLGLLLLRNGEQMKAIEQFQVSRKINPKYIGPTIAMAKIYASKGDFSKAIKELQSHKNSKAASDNIILALILAYYNIKSQNMIQALNHLKNAENLLPDFELGLLQGSIVYLQKQIQNMHRFISHAQNRTIEQHVKWQQLKSISSFIQAISSWKEEHLNAVVSKLRQTDYGLLSFVQKTFLNSFSFNHTLLQELSSLNLNENLFFQAFNISIIQFLKQTLEQQSSSEVQSYISDILNRLEITVASPEESEEEETIEANKKIYTIKYSDKQYYLFKGKYFSSYQHLFTTLKKIKKEMKSAQSEVNNLIESILCSQPEDAVILQKVDSLNLKECIDQLIIQALPEVKKQKQHYYSKIDQQLSQNKEYYLLTISKLMDKEMKTIIDSALSSRRNNKQPLSIIVEDWIQGIFFFNNQTTIVNVIKALQLWCRTKNYEITKVEGSLLKTETIPGVSIKIKVHNVCCKMTFFHQIHKVQALLTKNIEKLTSFGLGCSAFSILEVSKVQRQHLSEVLLDAMSCERKGSFFYQQLNDLEIAINRFLADIEINQLSDNPSSFQRSTYSKDLQRQSQKFKTQILRIQNRDNNFLTQINTTSRAHKHSLDQSDYRSESTIIRKIKIRQNQEKYRTRTQDNESLDQQQQHFNPKFEEADIEDNTSGYKDRKRMICKSIQIAIQGLKIHEQDDHHSKTTEGETQLNNLKETILQMEATIHGLEQSQKSMKDQLQKQKQLNTTLEENLRVTKHQNEKYQGQIRGLQSISQKLDNTLEKMAKMERSALESADKLTQLSKIKESQQKLKEKQLMLQSQIQQLKINEALYKSQLQSLQQQSNIQNNNEEQNLNESTNLIIQEIKGLKKTLSMQDDHNFLFEKINNIESELKVLQSKVDNQNSIARQVQLLHSQITQREKEAIIMNEKISQPQLEINENPIVAEVGVLTEIKFDSQEGEEQLATDSDSDDNDDDFHCQTCLELRQRNWQLNKKIYYHGLIFMILFFEAITFSFSTYIFK